jgi:hypothetical protein
MRRGRKDYAQKGYQRNQLWPVLRYFADVLEETSIIIVGTRGGFNHKCDRYSFIILPVSF